ncbi:hypothetical protein [Nonomuraea sp. NPDC002799]
MTDLDRGTDRRGRRAKRILTPLQKYEVWLQLIRQETTVAGAAINWQVDPSTVTRIKAVAKEGALTALSESKPGARARERDWEVEALRADNARLAEAVKQMAVKLTLIEGKEGWG